MAGIDVSAFPPSIGWGDLSRGRIDQAGTNVLDLVVMLQKPEVIH